MPIGFCVRLVAIAIAGLLVAAPLAAAQSSVEQFYKGKSIDVIIGYPPAGSNDTYARALARHMGKHIPGRPNLVPKNMPGAGSFLAVNNMFNVLPKDGTQWSPLPGWAHEDPTERVLHRPSTVASLHPGCGRRAGRSAVPRQ